MSVSSYPVNQAAFCVVALGAANWFYSPQKTAAWALVIGISIGILVLPRLLPACRNNVGAQNNHISRAQFLAFLILGSSLVFGLLQTNGLIDASIGKRSYGIVMGFVLIVTGNHLPKTVRSMTASRCDPARLMAAELFAGRVFVLAGIIYVAVWIFGPLDQVNLLSSLVGLSAFALVLARWLTTRTKRNSPHG